MPRARLDVTDLLGSRSVPIDQDLFRIGRRSSHDLSLSGGDVSRDHAQIERRDGRFILRDGGSRCGTFVNGTPVTERTLEHGDPGALGHVVRIGLIAHEPPRELAHPPLVLEHLTHALVVHGIGHGHGVPCHRTGKRFKRPGIQRSAMA